MIFFLQNEKTFFYRLRNIFNVSCPITDDSPYRHLTARLIYNDFAVHQPSMWKLQNSFIAPSIKDALHLPWHLLLSFFFLS